MPRFLVVLVLIVFLAGTAQAVTLSDKMHSNVARGNRYYEAGEHQLALERYTEAQAIDSTEGVPHFNAGDALFRLGKFPEGAGEFTKSAASPADSLAAMSYYNLGNSLCMAGDLKSAVEAYKKSLLIDPDDQDAKYNLELALRMMQEQQQKQQQKQQQDQKGQQDQQKQQQQEQERKEQAQQQQETQEQQEQGQQPPAPAEISPEELDRIMAAIEASDKDTQEEMLRKMSRRKRVTGEDW